MNYLPHVIKSGDRIDKLSLKYYGRVDNAEPIYAANPVLKFSSLLNDYIGITILIPIQETTETAERIRPGIKAVE